MTQAPPLCLGSSRSLVQGHLWSKITPCQWWDVGTVWREGSFYTMRTTNCEDRVLEVWGSRSDSCATWRLRHPVPLTSFSAPSGATGGSSFSLTDAETGPERRMTRPRSHSKQLAEPVCEPSFVCPQSLSSPRCICGSTVLTDGTAGSSPQPEPSCLASVFAQSRHGRRHAGPAGLLAVCESRPPGSRPGLVNSLYCCSGQ